MKIKRKINYDRIKLVTGIIGSLVLLVIIFYIISEEEQDVKPYKSFLDKNMLKMDNISLTYIIDNNTYVLLNSKNASANIGSLSVLLKNFKVDYYSKNLHVLAIAENGKYEMERYITGYGSVHGYLDESEFIADNKSSFTYDYKLGKGRIINGVEVKQGKNLISAKNLEFEQNSQFVHFTDNVTVEYFVDNEKSK